MKLFKTLIIGTFFLFGTQACQSKKLASNQIEVSGILQKQGMTTYQYGTHIIVSNDKQYALKSSTLDLNKHQKQYVTIIGEKIAGYPIEGGPDYLEVIKVK
ncbi:MAG: hypothetical protein DRI54_05980 [Bacteroidetes bacterium]|nr:MAG: hypothetical protein DRI54_05980 [Bacteroidota bacterium]